jgi:hypothetical protein
VFLFSSVRSLLRRRELPVYPYFLPDFPGPALRRGTPGREGQKLWPYVQRLVRSWFLPQFEGIGVFVDGGKKGFA